MKDTLLANVGNKSNMMKLFLDKEFMVRLKTETSFMDTQEPKNAHRVYSIIHNISTIPLCPTCGGMAKLNMTDHSLGWRRYCSDACSKASKSRTSHVLELSDKEYLFDARVTKKKAISQIAEELGVSTQPVLDALHRFGISGDSRKRNSGSISKEKIYTQYIDGKQTMSEVAKSFNVSKSTISIYAKKYAISARGANEYDRRISHISQPQRFIFDFVSQYFPDAIMCDRKTIGVELDIYVPSKKFAIEYNGFPYHFYGFNDKDGTLHVNKTNLCDAEGIRLLHLFPSDLYDKTEVLESIIKQKLGVSSIKVYARECEIKAVSVFDKNTFLNENHLQGADKSKIKIGLYHRDILVALMTFGSSRFNKKYDWELIRFACKKNTTVCGGFSKLLSAFRKENSGSIVSYADRRYSDGGVYIKNGFTHINTSKPAYYYVEKNSMVLQHRMKFQKKNISKFGVGDTEEQIMKHAGYNRVYDCGTMTFGLDK